MINRLTILLLNLLLGVLSLSATTLDELPLVGLKQTDGLLGESVSKIMTDKYGLIWIATNSGVNSYNGKEIHSLPITGSHGGPLEVYDLCEVQYSIYAATEEGLWRITRESGCFERVLPEIQQPRCLLAVGDTLYIGSSQGLHVFAGQQLKHQDVSVSRQGLDNMIRQFVRDEKGMIWFLGRHWLGNYDPRTGKMMMFKSPSSFAAYIPSQFEYIGKGRFVIGTHGNGLFLYDHRQQTVEHIQGVGNVISSVQASADGSICVATNGTGAYRLEERDGHLMVGRHFGSESSGKYHLPTNALNCYYRDANGVNWFGFVRYGLAYTYHIGTEFIPFSVADFSSEGINVRTFCRHGNDMLIGTQDGFYYVNTATGFHRYFSPAELGGAHIVNAMVWYEGKFYFGTFDGGMRMFDPQTLQISKQPFTPLLDDASIGDLQVGPEGRLWIGSNRGLMIVDEGKVQQHFTEQNSRIVRGFILSITFDDKGNAWLTGSTGCALYSALSHEIVETEFPQGFFNRHPWMRGATGHDGLVFMRTGPQTFYTNTAMTDFGELKLPVVFKDKWCRSFLDDMKGHYLVASERGLYCFDYDLQSATHFGYGEGLIGDYINDIQMAPDGKIWVATSQGLYITESQKWLAWVKTTKYKVQLLNIRHGSDLYSESETYYANINRRLAVSWNLTSEVLQAECFLMDYGKPDGRMYQYRVNGGEWKSVSDEQSMYITGLALGINRLEVRLARCEGSSTVYTIMVLPSAWAIVELILFIVACTLLWLWWRYRKNTNVLLSERNEIEDALVAMEEAMQQEELREEPKYERVKIVETECEGIVSRMKEYLEREKVYTNQDLKMKDLADVLHLSAPKLSQVFNLYLKENYYEFINRYRLNEFKRLIAEGEYKRYTITALSEKCGFKKSNFFSTFRKIEGMTPAEYLKKKGVNLA